MEVHKISLGKKLHRYLLESLEELKKVSWPGRKLTVRQTVIVVVVSLITAIFLGILDYLFQFGLSQFVIK